MSLLQRARFGVTALFFDWFGGAVICMPWLATIIECLCVPLLCLCERSQTSWFSAACSLPLQGVICSSQHCYRAVVEQYDTQQDSGWGRAERERERKQVTLCWVIVANCILLPWWRPSLSFASLHSSSPPSTASLVCIPLFPPSLILPLMCPWQCGKLFWLSFLTRHTPPTLSPSLFPFPPFHHFTSLSSQSQCGYHGLILRSWSSHICTFMLRKERDRGRERECIVYWINPRSADRITDDAQHLPHRNVYARSTFSLMRTPQHYLSCSPIS